LYHFKTADMISIHSLYHPTKHGRSGDCHGKGTCFASTLFPAFVHSPSKQRRAWSAHFPESTFLNSSVWWFSTNRVKRSGMWGNELTL